MTPQDHIYAALAARAAEYQDDPGLYDDVELVVRTRDGRCLFVRGRIRRLVEHGHYRDVRVSGAWYRVHAEAPRGTTGVRSCLILARWRPQRIQPEPHWKDRR